MTGAQDEFLAAQVLAGFAWPEPPPQTKERRRLAAVASSSSSEHTDSDHDGEPGRWFAWSIMWQASSFHGMRHGSALAYPAYRAINQCLTLSGHHDATPALFAVVECRPRKVRVLSPTGSESSQLLTRRTYTWRGICCRRAEKQQRQLEALHHQQLQQAAAPSLPAHSSGSDTEPGCPTPTAAEGQAQQAAAAPSSGAAAGCSREGDRDWAALTTWLRMVRGPSEW